VGQSALAVDILGGKIPSPWLRAASVLIAMAFAAIFLWLAARLFSSEKIIFGR
jgi:NO-binding membrane sensor protein with MHYT domain